MMMKRMIGFAALAYCIVGPTNLSAQTPNDSSQVAQVVHDYIVGWRNGDLELLAQVFDPEEGVVLWASGGEGAEKLNGMTFGEIIARGSRPHATYGLESQILSLDVVDGKLAVAKVHISRSGGSYVDYLVLYKSDRGWRIVTKTFVTR